MGTIVDATVPASELALAETFSAEPEATFRTVGLVAGGQSDIIPFLWADHDDLDRLTAVIERDGSVAAVEQITTAHDSCLLRTEWNTQLREFASTLAAADASIIEASGYDGTWHTQLFLPNHDTASKAREFLQGADFDLSVSEVTCLSDPSAHGGFGITECQYRTVVRAYDAGYYDVPRTVSQAELASEFPVSHQALSERLRRAHRTVITNALYQKVYPRESAVSARCTAKSIATRQP